MGYAHQILGKFAKLEGRRPLPKRFVNSVACAYCRRSGVDPKYELVAERAEETGE